MKFSLAPTPTPHAMKIELRLVQHGDWLEVEYLANNEEWFNVINFENQYLTDRDVKFLQAWVDENDIESIDEFYWLEYRKVN